MSDGTGVRRWLQLVLALAALQAASVRGAGAGAVDIVGQVVSAAAAAKGCHYSCYDCNNKGACTECMPKTGLNAAKRCVPCANEFCYNCEKNFKQCVSCASAPTNRRYYSDANRQCQRCDYDGSKGCNPAAGCNQDGSCKACLPGYTMIKGECIQCPDSCSDCKGNPPKCTKCAAGSTLNRYGFCVMCTMNAEFGPRCADCTGNPKRCRHCRDGFFLTKAGLCLTCPNGCNPDYYSNPPDHYNNPQAGIEGPSGTGQCKGGVCQRCNVGYVLSKSGLCRMCGLGCLECDAKNPKVCLTCRPNAGFVLDPKTKSCARCKAANCATCPNAATAKCAQCEDGYGRQANGLCARCLNFGCRNCDGNANTCRACHTEMELPFDGNGYGTALLILDPQSKLCISFDESQPAYAPSPESSTVLSTDSNGY